MKLILLMSFVTLYSILNCEVVVIVDGIEYSYCKTIIYQPNCKIEGLTFLINNKVEFHVKNEDFPDKTMPTLTLIKLNIKIDSISTVIFIF